MQVGKDSLKVRAKLKIGNQTFDYFSLKIAQQKLGDISKLPYSLKILLENLLRHEDGRTVTTRDIQALVDWTKTKKSNQEIAFRPARVLMQDFTGVPAVIDLAVMRDAMVKMGADPRKINPLSPVDLVIDHSVMVDYFGTPDAFRKNVELEYQRNGERYAFLRWGQTAFNNFRVVPPGTGICHQVNLEYLAQVVWSTEGKDPQNNKNVIVYPDTVVGTDSHTTMVNGLAVLGWGVGGVEAEAAMLGQPISMTIPEVVGFKLTGQLKEGTTATDLVLNITQTLREKGVVNKFVEFYGPGLNHLTLADRATIANMAPEYGATCGFFPIDAETIRYLKFTGRPLAQCELVEHYAKEQGLWRDEKSEPIFTETLALDISTVESCLAGPRLPQEKVLLSQAKNNFISSLTGFGKKSAAVRTISTPNNSTELMDGDVVIAAITSCTNTSNPSVMLGAALLAKHANEKGLQVKPWVKTSLAPGSQVVTDYFAKAGLQQELDKIGFHLVGYGCTTCIGNSGPLPAKIAEAIEKKQLVVSAVLSGNRNFEGRVNSLTKANYLASPMLVVAYALAGTMAIDLLTDPIGFNQKGKPVYLKDIWPSNQEIDAAVRQSITPEMFQKRYGLVFEGDAWWQNIKTPKGLNYQWDKKSSYVRQAPYFNNFQSSPAEPKNITGARILAVLGDNITTDHISPAGSIEQNSPAGLYLAGLGVQREDFNSYGARRGNHEVMMRGTFANIRLRNELVPGKEGGFTRTGDGQILSIYDAAMQYQKTQVPLVIVAGKEYGTGSSRDWAAKGPKLLGVEAVVAESFERIHRSNLIALGILPLQFHPGTTRQQLQLNGTELLSVVGISAELKTKMGLTLTIRRENGQSEQIPVILAINTEDEIQYYKNGGILPYVLRQLVKK